MQKYISSIDIFQDFLFLLENWIPNNASGVIHDWRRQNEPVGDSRF